MSRPMEGVRVLEVAEHTFVPSAGAILADWGADVIKVENPITGAAQRGVVVVGRSPDSADAPFVPSVEGPNRGKRSIGLVLSSSSGRQVFHRLLKSSDVFLTSYLPIRRARLHISVDEVRRVNPSIIDVAGSGYGMHGRDRGTDAHELAAFWARSGGADGATPCDAESTGLMPATAYGDNIGGLALAAGVAAALYQRSTTGQPSAVDVSLLAVGAWATQHSVNMALLDGGPMPRFAGTTHDPCNPLMATYRTGDGRFIQLSMARSVRWWPELCTGLGRAEYAHDPRFDSAESIIQNGEAAAAILRNAIGSRTFEECVRLLRDCPGHWAPVQDSWEVGNDESLRANGRIADVIDASGRPQKLVANPVHFGGEDTQRLKRAPKFAENTDEVLRELGFDDSEVLELRVGTTVT